LRNKLNNDLVQLTISLNKSQATATSLTDAEFYALMRKEHPYLNTLIKDFHMTLI
jgi:hypothetical protein